MTASAFTPPPWLVLAAIRQHALRGGTFLTINLEASMPVTPPDDFRRMTDEEAQAAVTHLHGRALGAEMVGLPDVALLLRRIAREFEAARAGEADQRRLLPDVLGVLKQMIKAAYHAPGGWGAELDEAESVYSRAGGTWDADD